MRPTLHSDRGQTGRGRPLYLLWLAIFAAIALVAPVRARTSLTVPSDYSVTTFAQDVSARIAGMTFDPIGNLIVADKNQGFDCSTIDGRVVSFDQSGTGTVIVNSNGIQQDIADVAYGPGGDWGTGLYFVDENAHGCAGNVVRVEPDGSHTQLVVGALWGIGYSNFDRMVFGPGNGFGTDLFVTDFSNGGTDGAGFGNSGGIIRVQPNGASSIFKFGAPFVDPYDIKFGIGNGFGTDMYVADFGNFGGTGHIWRVAPDATTTLLAGGASTPFISPSQMAFGPGGAFGSELYVRDFDAGKIFRVSESGEVTTFAQGLETASSNPGQSLYHYANGGMTFDPDGQCLYVVNDNDILKICGSGAENGPDTDGDGFPNAGDNCPFTANPGQQDGDSDGVGDACDLDDDGDGTPDDVDPCPLLASASVTVTVPGYANPWLAGIPPGGVNADLYDVVPAHSPILVPSISVHGGARLKFLATGGVDYGDGVRSQGPDGISTFAVPHGVANGIGSVVAPANALMGVFLSDAQPAPSDTPGNIDFFGGPDGVNYATLAPQLQQIFFIGDGLANGVPQGITAPAGAARLYLGTMDGFGWFNNGGAFTVTITDIDAVNDCGPRPPTDVGIEKNASTTSVQVGAELTFFVRVQNYGPGPATQVVFNDAMPANFEVVSITTDRGTCGGVGTSTVNCWIGDMSAPTPVDVVAIDIVARAKAPGVVRNTGTAGHGEPDTNPGNDSGTSEDISIQPAFAGISVDKIGRVLSDGMLEFTITILNLKATPASNVRAQDTLQPDLRLVSVRSDDPTATCPADPAPGQNVQSVLCTLPTLAGSAAWQLVIIAEVMKPGPIENTATGGADDLDPWGGIPSKTIYVGGGGPGAILEKTVEGAFYTGGIGTYRFNVSAPGGVPGPVWVIDHLPAGLTFVTSTTTGGFVCTAAGQDVTCKRPNGLFPGETATILLQVNVNAPAGQDVVNQGTILWLGGGGPSNPVPIRVGTPPLTIRKTVAPPEFGRLVYTIDAINTGTVAVNHVTITDDLPPTVRFVSVTPASQCHGPDPVFCDLGTMLPGQSAQVIITVEYLVAGTITNGATIIGDDVPGAADTVDITTPLGSDLKAEKYVSAPAVFVGDELRYTLRVRNLGPRVAQYAQIIDPIPAGLQVTSVAPDAGMICNNPPVPFIAPNATTWRLICSTQNLTVNAFKQVVITVRTLTSGPLANSITVEGDPGDVDPAPGNNTAGPVTTTVRNITLGDRVWNDLDNDGRQDAGEPGISGVIVNLLDASGAFLGSTVTASYGAYSFNVLSHSTYGIVIAAANFTGSGVLNGYSSTRGGDGESRSIVTTSLTNADFGYKAVNRAPVCSAALPSSDELWPPNHKWEPIGILNLSDPDGDSLTTRITSIFQDEPTSGLGGGDTPIDGDGVGTDTARVRAERGGTGNGRVYHIRFSASDGVQSCSGEVTVKVPHDQSGTASDGGSLYNSSSVAPGGGF